jgi:hypothetical protein
MKYEAVGIGKTKIGSVNAWQVTFETAPAEDDNIPGLLHLIFPEHTIAVMAQEFGLDADEDFDEAFDIFVHQALAGNDAPTDSVDPPQPQELMARSSKAKQDKKNQLGRKMARRAERAKQEHDITGLDAVRERVRPERANGLDGIKARIEMLERQRRRKDK